MSTIHHILFSRVLGVVAFCAFLVLTPRAWVEPDGTATTEEVPVNALEAPSDCLWCEPAQPATDCDESETTSARPWLNPDESAAPLELPCPGKPASTPHS